MSVSLLAAGLVAACASSTPAASEGGDSALFDETAELDLTVVLSEFKFEPGTVEIPAGQLVAIALSNDGTSEHDFTIKQIAGDQGYRIDGDLPSTDRRDGEDVHVALLPGASAELRLRATEPGEYELYCAVSGHRRAGMRTTLAVR